ncbi:hypothetical protein A3843_13800 [Pseudovibrio exalbescens]|uniref:Porin n=2 Tax=Pseudovibrio exalbescens TaxID=197461 RepID=A0A1U7JG02_9HYPH|nr:hypothetical protein A3843_13800 [Pseudovibrio exalbescens]
MLATAGAAVATSASAADLPVVAEPVDYVQVCDAYGAGFFKIPGKDTCLKIGGRIRTQIVSDNLNDNDDTTKYEDYSAYARGYLYLTSMTDTEIGLIRTVTEFNGTWDQKAGSSVGVDDVYLQISGNTADILIGRESSIFDGFTGAVDMGIIDRNLSDKSTLQVTLMKSFGNGVSAALSVEDSSYRAGDKNSANFVGMLGISQGWGSFEVAGALHNPIDNGAFGIPGGAGVAGKAENDYGYAVRGTATFNLDMIAPGDAFVFQAAYADSAASYLNANADDFGFVDVNGKKAGAAFLDMLGAKGYALGAGFSHYWTPEIATSIDGSYASLTSDFLGSDIDWDRWAVDASIGWYPVSGMVVALEAGFANSDLEVDGDSVDFDEAKVGARVQYTF